MDSLAALATANVAGRIVYFHRQMAESGRLRESLRAADPWAGEGGEARSDRRAGALGGHRVAPLSSPRRRHRSSRSPKDAIPRSPSPPRTRRRSPLAGHRPVRVRLVLGCRTAPDVESANVIAEVKGREKPGEIVLLGAHLDSWDLAVGAQTTGREWPSCSMRPG